MENKELNLETLGFKDATKNDKKIFIALTADYRNIGDIAITIAQRKLLSDIFPDRKIVEIPMTNAFDYENYIKDILNEDDILTLIGGGNLGNVYLSFEERRRFIIELFKNNKSISFPQSIDFLLTSDGIEEFKKSIEIYSQNQNLTILAREHKSFEIMKNNFKNNVKLVPDIVFYLRNKLTQSSNLDRKNITLCLRNDREKITCDSFAESLESLLIQNNFKDISIVDTIIENKCISSSARVTALEEFFNKNYYNSKLIITDRLHGMIFAIITNTPCIAFDNSNKKISSTYHTWLKDYPLVKFFDKFDEKEILEVINYFHSNNFNDTTINFEEEFNELINLLN